MSKMTLKSRISYTGLGLLGIMLPALALSNYHGPDSASVSIGAVLLASVTGLIAGRRAGREHNADVISWQGEFIDKLQDDLRDRRKTYHIDIEAHRATIAELRSETEELNGK